jgi:hypothetical protein
MISNERPSPFRSVHDNHYSNFKQPYQAGQGKPRVDEDTLKKETIQIERKTFVFTLKENPRGRFLRITEDVGGRRDNIIIPSTGLEDFARILQTMVVAANEGSAS